ncbi:hypothetical protein ACP70R_041094 [Stipagrostis hirtigluma subsp. patula]
MGLGVRTDGVATEEFIELYRRFRRQKGPSKTFCFLCHHRSSTKRPGASPSELSMETMKTHCESRHADILKMPRAQTCTTCGNVFPNREELREHIRLFHQDEHGLLGHETYALSIGATLENLTNLQPKRGCDDPTFVYCVDLKCPKCGKVEQKKFLTLSDEEEVPSGDYWVNLLWKFVDGCSVLLMRIFTILGKCKRCSKKGTVLLVPGHGEPLTLEQSYHKEMSRLMLFECRGYEPTHFTFSDGWKVESVYGSCFNIDCTEGFFSEYDSANDAHLCLKDLNSAFSEVV